MTDDPESDGWQSTTDHSRIREWADEHDAVPILREGEGGNLVLDVGRDSERWSDDRITWDDFFDRFDSENLTFRYREEPMTEGDDVVRNVVEHNDGASQITEGGTDREPVATNDVRDDEDLDTWQTTTDRSRIETWVDEHDGVPIQREGSGGELVLDVTLGPAGVSDEEITWDRFFERFEGENLAFRYREGGPDGDDDVACNVVDRDDGTDRIPEDDSDQEKISLSDTGGTDAVVPEGSGEGSDEGAAEPDDETAMSESARGSETNDLVLDEIYENPGLVDSDIEEEYVVFKNDGAESIDLSGWRVDNDTGQSYVFPDGVVLDSGERLTLHSGDGVDTATEQYWDASEPVWDERGGTVTVTTSDGRRILREPYKG